MSNIAALKTTTDNVRVVKAKRAFVLGTLDLTWRLLGAMLAPILLGAYLDTKLETGQTLTIVGVLLSLILGGLVIRSIVSKFSGTGSGS